MADADLCNKDELKRKLDVAKDALLKADRYFKANAGEYACDPEGAELSAAPAVDKALTLLEVDRASKEESYYLQDTRTIIGNCITFWRKGSAGYTTDLDEAEEFTLKEALSKRDTDRPWPVSMMRDLARPRVDHQVLPRGEGFPK